MAACGSRGVSYTPLCEANSRTNTISKWSSGVETSRLLHGVDRNVLRKDFGVADFEEGILLCGLGLRYQKMRRQQVLDSTTRLVFIVFWNVLICRDFNFFLFE